MRRWLFLLLLTSVAFAQAPQTPRQALLEIIKATSPEQIDKRTPDVLLKELAKLPPDVRQKEHQSIMFLSLIMAMSPNAVQTFETGPIFAVVQNPKDNSKAEITVERDDLMGDTDAFELGVRYYKDGKQQDLPFDPRLLIDMKLEKNVWKLARIGGSASIQLDDPKVAAQIVKSIQEQIKKANAMSSNTGSAAPRTTAEMNIVGSLRSLNTAEKVYSQTYPKIGYTCRLSDLGGSTMNGKPADEHGAQLITPALEAGLRFGYRIEISGCVAAKNYKIMATPMQKGVGHRVYCTDQTAVVRSVEEAGAAGCWTAGTPLN